jgi:zinc transport system substrate-binding protein
MQKLNRCITRLCKALLFFSCCVLFFFPTLLMAKEVVLASTSLTGAIAKAAGAKEVRVLTPGEIRHPPEYDLRPSDLLRFEGADIVVYGGYERMVQKLLETSKNRNILAIQIDTDTAPENLRNQVRKISKTLGTEKEAQVWEESFVERLKLLQKKISPYAGRKAVVHRFAQPFARWAGLHVIQIISPGELTPRVIGDAVMKKPELVVDILHFPNAKVIAENAGCKYVQVINFPGVENTKTIEDLFEYNSTQLLKVLE